MTSRVGSILIAMLLGVVALIAAIVIVVLVDGDGRAEDAAVVVSSLRDDDIVLLGEPIEIRVTVRDTEPVTSVELVVDDEPVGRDAQPVEDPTQGDFIATFSWAPERLGFADLTIRAVSVSGKVSELTFRVEVTDDPSRLPATLQVGVLSPRSAQRVPVDESLAVLVQAGGDVGEPAATFTLEVDGLEVDSAPAETSEGGGSVAVLNWTPRAPGVVTLRVRARTLSGQEGVTEVTVEVVGEAVTEGGGAGSPADDDSDQLGLLSIRDPQDGDEFPYAEDLSIDLDIAAEDTGRIVNLEVYVNADFLLNLEPDRLPDGSYRLSIPFQPPAPGDYSVQAVAFSESGQRFDARVEIRVLEGEESTEGPLPDLVPLAITVGEGNRVVVTVANQGEAAIQSATVLISVERTADRVLLAETEKTLTLSRGGSQAITLPTVLNEELEITVLLDGGNAVAELDEGNNEITALFQPAVGPDLVAQGLELSQDRRAIVRIGNVGAANFSGTLRVLLLFNGQAAEQLSFTGVLAVQGSLTLTGATPIEGAGELSAIIDPGNEIAEANEGNNLVTITITP